MEDTNKPILFGQEVTPLGGRGGDMVNHPPHYTVGGIECIDAVDAAVESLHGYEAVYTGHILRYVWRWKFKNGIEDLKKARWYLNRLINKLENRSAKHGSNKTSD